ncbi:hypothetical protein [Methylobacterium sp. Leaf93]|uniref:hypothetical protein n=1 Tax=Methylobacterium sp. Leaf93 TaxID=1736249 RepID=UPI001FCDD292|nr:hypothetical protein [Methylobacterium sp. Leaf93]
MNNIEISLAKANIIVFLNNDTSIMNGDWLTEMVSHAVRREIGCVGARLHYDNGTIQHAGVFIGICGVASHPYRGFDAMKFGYSGRLRVVQNLSAVTAACLAVRRSVALEVGGR